MEIDNDFTEKEVEGEKTRKWKKKAQEATRPDGLSAIIRDH